MWCRATRSLDLSNTGNQNLATVALTSTASPSSLLDTDATNGLHMVVDKCTTAWVEAVTTPAFTYTCGGTLSTVIASRAVIGANLNLASLAALTSAGTDHLRVTLTLPSATGNNLPSAAEAARAAQCLAKSGRYRD